ncbi:hypothetical protein HZP13_14435 [Elizabethkingia anophelis]|nr:hypothetical protein [Elizabethkingia anophelis]
MKEKEEYRNILYNDKLTPPEVLNKLSEYLNVSTAELAETIGYDRPQSLYDVINGKTKRISQKMADKILDKFPNINSVWILTGEGNMLLNESKNITHQSEQKLLPPSGSKVKVPYYDVDFSGGWSSDEVFSMAPPSFYITSPNFERAEFACNLSGNSISQIIPSGSVVGFKEIFNWQTYFLTNELYGIVTKNDLRTVKLVKRSKENKNNLVLIPCPLIEYDKAGYESEEIPMDFVARFYQVIAWAKFERLVM